MPSKNTANAISNHELVNDSTLHVVSVISNPVRFHSRFRLFRDFEQEMLATKNVKLYVVELAQGDVLHEVTVPGHPNHLQLRSPHVMWSKEAMINLGVRHLVLPHNPKYIATVDADIKFNDPSWALNTIHALQHHHVVQPFSDAIDEDPHGNVLQLFKSFSSLSYKGIHQKPVANSPYPYGHSGFAWAYTKAFWENTGGMIQGAILGSADYHQAWALVGKATESMDDTMSEGYQKMVLDWQTKAMQVTHGNLGFIHGIVNHKWHGKKRERFYKERRMILKEHTFDPIHDLRIDEAGLPYIHGKPALTEAVLKYMRSRNEDSVDEE